uniref:Molybdenum cofactor guanylyltransferase n=1 Tax=Roseihalotalea indica TaxID=2867963 RepID=A0AA49GRV0_9BACT|nr:molybdenum cofactor guanylyltransferase [Tunicatimonas sp. TK19036]
MSINTDTISALILCGGLSSRMGTDKGLKEEQGTPWAQQLYNRLSESGITTYLSVRPDQQSSYTRRMPDIPHIVDEVLTEINGPLRGLLSAHRFRPQQHWLLTPCDVPRLSTEVFTYWISTFQQQYPQSNAVISHTEQRLQPVCGIYSQEALSTLNTLYQQGRLANQSMHAIVEDNLNSYLMEIPAEMASQYKNFNTPHDED